MKLKRNIKSVLAAVLLIGFVSCEDLEVENLNALDINGVLSNPAEFPALVQGAYGQWWNQTQISYPNMYLSVAAQVFSSSWTNYAMFDGGRIPPRPFVNSNTASTRLVNRNPWRGIYNSIGPVNDVLKVMNANFEGKAIDPVTGQDNTPIVLANARMMQGLALGWVSLIFDRGFIVSEELTDEELGSLEFSNYRECADAAKARFLEAATIFDANPDITFNGFNGVTLPAVEAARFARSYAAKIEVFSARNADQTVNETDWNEVLQLTTNGLTMDIAPNGDGGNQWWTRALRNGQFAGWVRIPQRLINMMEGGSGGRDILNPADTDPNHPTAPYPWQDNVLSYPEITTPRDQRILTDFTYNSNVPFRSDRGFYIFGNYSYSRYIYFVNDNLVGPMPHFTVTENNLLRAEALIRTGGNKAEAAQLINSTRVDRGGLTPLTGAESDDVLLREVTYERLVELSWHSSTNGYLARRITTVEDLKLPPGTPLSLPVPASELEALGIPNYTFGGLGNPDGSE
ncbi:RagB/SusD family nutrient uptake outer membrane protein [Roseivirga sp. E12]|uniref:RagB/SusD family nutrient uptake outer membrane protein n=1 Tax=Roseivirga sp. E12 TaxID=2819237 RepID=UPI001ABCF717|nr:RagB/SusD family nutrient uptake outer membrane protein [Roseivirga sp. E12]MBO3697707.1 RagB/SusD family nutrient uptake outer membrane protein [Roseivirga sp. E12]